MGERREWFLFFMVSEVSVCCLGAYGKAVCFDGKQVTKEAEPFVVAGKRRERKEGQIWGRQGGIEGLRGSGEGKQWFGC